MQKILLAIDALQLDHSALEFACYMSRLTNSRLTGIFLENLVAGEKLMVKRMHGVTYLDWDIDESSLQYKEQLRIIERNMNLFRETCDRKGVRFNVHQDEGVPLREMVEESRFADLLIIDAATTFRKKIEGLPTDFVKDVLKDSECPVIIAPEKFEDIKEIVFAFSGDRSSAYAIKQFTYLLPQLDDKKITVLQVNDTGEWEENEKKVLQEWLQHHYSAVGFEVLRGKAEFELFTWLLKKENVLVVMGAFGRNTLSSLFKHSSAGMVLKSLDHPVFITHC